MPEKLSIIINTKNAARTLARTLESVKFADEVVLVDQHSQDETREVAKKHQAKVFLFEDLGRVEPEARNFALSKASFNWVLMVDADEVVPITLAQKIKTLMSNTPDNVAGYFIPRKNLIFQAWIQHSGWWPDYQLRLFRKKDAFWPEGVHSQVNVAGQVRKLAPKESLAIVHYNYQTVGDFIKRMDRYSTVKAKEVGKLKSGSKNISQDLTQAFFDEWLRRMFYHQAYLDGARGVTLSFLQSSYELLVVFKLWERAGFKPEEKQNSNELMSYLFNFKKDLSYWLADYQVKHTRGFKRLYWQLKRKFKF